MKIKIYNFIAIPTILVLLFSACSSATPTTPATAIPVVSTSTITSSPEPTGTPTITPFPPTPTLVPESSFIKGITLNYSGNGPKLGTMDAQKVIEQYILPSGANYVILVPTCWSINMRDTNIVCSDERIEGGVPPISDKELVNAIQYLHSAGLRVALKPQALIQTIHISETELKQRYWSKTEWKQWFDSYTIFITHYAKLAEDNQVDLFVVGNEQEDNTQREQDWRDVIAAVRNVYEGSITYAANAWQFEASRIKFWDALDYIGTNGYQFGFTNKTDPTVDEMVQTWQPYLQRLEEMSIQYGKQVIITEVGGRPMQGYNTGRYKDDKATLYDGQEQANFYSAFFEALKDKPWLKGIIVWDMDTEPLQGGAYDIGYTFIEKPAEQVVRQYFGGSPITPTPLPDFAEIPENSWIIYEDDLGHGWRRGDDPQAPPSALDFYSTATNKGSNSIRLSLSKYKELVLVYGYPYIKMSKYKWIEFYINVGKNQPKELLVSFDYWMPEEHYGSRVVSVASPNYIEGGQYLPDTWQRVRIPLVDLGITDQNFNSVAISGCVWPCPPNPNPYVDDIYIDDIQLIAGETKESTIIPTPTVDFVEDPDNSMPIYEDNLENDWQMWDEPNITTPPIFDSPNGYQGSSSIRLQLSKMPGLILLYNKQGLDMSKYKWLEFYIMVGENQPKDLIIGIGDWAAETPAYKEAIADNPYYIEGSKYYPGTWQRVRIPLSDLGITDQTFTAPAFGIRNCGWPCQIDFTVDDIYIDDMRLVAGK